MQLDIFVDSLWDQLNLTNKTKKNYLGAWARNLKPHLGTHNLKEISKAQLIDAIASLTPQSKYQALMVLRVIFREALEREIISDNPAARIKSPKVEVKPQKFLTWEGIKETEFGFHNDRIRFLALHGLRYGEAAALTEDDIFDNRVHINKSIHGLTKTKSGIRSVPLLYPFTPFPYYQDGIAKALRPHGVTVHSLRKTYAYMLKSSQVHVTTAAKLLGHSNPMITMKIYTQVLDDEIDKTGDVMRNFMDRAS
jgi:integrase